MKRSYRLILFLTAAAVILCGCGQKPGIDEKIQLHLLFEWQKNRTSPDVNRCRQWRPQDQDDVRHD
jgi:hypothetical protein